MNAAGEATAVSLMTEPAACELCKSSAGALPEASGWDFEYGTSRAEFRIVRCGGCGLMYLADRPVFEAMSLIYPPNYYSFDESCRQSRLVKVIRDRLESRKVAAYLGLLDGVNRSVLDVGCGDGRLLDILKARCSPLWTLMGIEIGKAAAVKAGEKGFSIIHGDFETYDSAALAGRFDLVLMHQVLEHTRSPREVIRKVGRLLKPGGLFSIETPDTESWDQRLFGRRYWGGYHIPRHFYLFNKVTLRRLLEEEGFEVLSCRSILSPVFWVHSVHNYLIEHRALSWLAPYAHYQNPLLLAIATLIDLVQTGLFYRSSNMQILSRRKAMA